MHRHLFLKKTIWGLAAISLVLGMLSNPGSMRQVAAKGGYDFAPSGKAYALQAANAYAATTFIGSTSTWKYSYNNTAPDSNWMKPGFDDSAWASGNAPLGFGNGSSGTIFNVNTSATDKPVTAYFRQVFSVTDPAQVSGLSLQMSIDDGAVIYLNGTEINRTNLPDGAISFSTNALSSGETRSVTVNVDAKLLAAGANVLAAEVHNNAPSGSDLVFQASLTGNVAAAAPTSAPTAAPTNAPTSAPTTAPTTAPTSGATTAPTATGAATTVPSTPTAAPTTQSSSGTTTTATTTLVPTTNWKYYYKSTAPSSAWNTTAFDDSTWASGNGPLGFGNGSVVTVFNVSVSSTTKPLTAYFRKSFSVADPSKITSLSLQMRIDDGDVAYLNGREVNRTNLPTGTITSTTKALSSGESRQVNVSVDPKLLVAGNNVLAVEVHNNDASGYDLIYSGTLIANGTSSGGSSTVPTTAPTAVPTTSGTTAPTTAPTAAPTTAPTAAPTAAPTTTSGAQLPTGTNWNLRWSDDFNGSSVDTTKWQINNKYRSEDTNRTYYRPENVSVSNGTLKLTVKKEAYGGANYTGGMLESTGNYRSLTYGYIEARIRYHLIGPGFWANFWMCGLKWPPEFDNEIVTQANHVNQVDTAHHYLDASGTHVASKTFTNVTYNDWHTYGIKWLPGQPVQFYLDGKLIFTSQATKDNPPTVPMYISMRAGAYYSSTWGGLPDSTTQYPGLAEYDWVRVWSAQ